MDHVRVGLIGMHRCGHDHIRPSPPLATKRASPQQFRSVRDVPDAFPLSEKQATQVRLAKTGTPEIDRAGIAAFMGGIAMKKPG